MATPIFIVKFPRTLTFEEIKFAREEISNIGIDLDYYVTFVPARDDEWQFQVLNVKDIDVITMEALEERLKEYWPSGLFKISDN